MSRGNGQNSLFRRSSSTVFSALQSILKIPIRQQDSHIFAYRRAAEVDVMRSGDLSAEAVAAILFGLLQLGIGFVSLWQQRQLRQAYRTFPVAVNRNMLIQ
jgi:hypothetical protein